MRKLGYIFVILSLVFLEAVVYNKKTDNSLVKVFDFKFFITSTTTKAENSTEILDLKESLKVAKERLRLFALINNENTFIIKNDRPKSELIYMTADWKLSRLPTHLKLTEEELEELRNKFLD